MPLNTLRLNQKSTHPNDRIVFIKSLEGHNKPTSEEFLNRLAAICVPIMKKYYLSVTTLEEYEPNREFWGRNFNAGECIQLVLRSPRTGDWLPMRFVQVVLMHELAHNEQMNHGRDFWKCNNRNKDELKELWGKGYTGEGMWGRGRTLYSGQLADNASIPDQDLPQNLCGGTYRSRRKRARKPKLSYQEQKERRIKRKFGDGGQALGGDETIRMSLEPGKWSAARPRVAKSKRGRELRANALLDRIAKEKAEKERQTPEHASEEDSETDSGEDLDEHMESARDPNGDMLKDARGRGLVKVCEAEGEEPGSARRELDELRQLVSAVSSKSPTPSKTLHFRQSPAEADQELEQDPKPAKGASRNLDPRRPSPTAEDAKATSASKPAPVNVPNETTTTKVSWSPSTPEAAQRESSRHDPATCDSPDPQGQHCGVCSLLNDDEALICNACANVLDTERMPRYWRCKSDVCKKSSYVNPEDAGVCGLCGSSKDTSRA